MAIGTVSVVEVNNHQGAFVDVERTALSKEFGKMQKDGYFTVRKNHFVILKTSMEDY